MITCKDCGYKLADDVYCENVPPCPECGSVYRTKHLTISDAISFGNRIKGKTGDKIGKNKRPSLEFISGDDLSRSLQKYVYRDYQVDRRNDNYYEIVRDKETGGIIHECNEPLSEHYGHGSAKSKKESHK